MLGEEYDLSAMVGVVSDLAVDRLQHRVRFGADVYGSAQIVRLQGADRGKYVVPSLFLPTHHVSPRGLCS